MRRMDLQNMMKAPYMKPENDRGDQLEEFVHALSDGVDPIIHMTTECEEKGVINMDSDGEDNRCTNENCLICRSFDKVQGVVDRHLLTEEAKEERDKQGLAEQQKRQAEEKEKARS